MLGLTLKVRSQFPQRPRHDLAKSLACSFRVVLFYLVAAVWVMGCGKGSGTPLANQGFQVASLAISDGLEYDFGSIEMGTTVSKTFTVRNNGAVEATQMTSSFFLSTSFTYLDGSFPGTGGTCRDNLKPNETCTIDVAFTAKYTDLTEAAIQISYFNGSAFAITSSPTLSGRGLIVTP